MWLETERLRLRRWSPREVDALYAIHAGTRLRDADAQEPTRDGCERWLEAQEAHWEAHGFGALALTPLADDTPLGWVALSTPTWLPAIVDEARPALELTWVVDARFQNRGLATEAATAWIDWAFQMLGADRILGITPASDLASMRVLDKLHMHVIGPLQHPKTGAAVIVRAVDCTRWRDAPAQRSSEASPPWHERLIHVE